MMIEFSYWLFPAIFLLFLFFPAWRYALLPGLLAAGIAGAANSAVLRKHSMAAAHCCAAALVVYLDRSESCEKNARSSEDKMVALAVWASLAILSTSLVPRCSWPYVLDKQQMLSIFLPALLVGAAA